jgi:hypothetical protein
MEFGSERLENHSRNETDKQLVKPLLGQNVKKLDMAVSEQKEEMFVAVVCW